MNFLAHMYLSQKPDELMLGNFIGDFVKGKKYEDYSPLVKKGILLHRSIDVFTDGHLLVKKSKKRLSSKYRHYSGVLIDVFYDHFLASQWGLYHQKSLSHFAAHCYKTIQKFGYILPDGAKYMLPYMIEGNWLVNYAKVAGIERTLIGLSKRSRFNNKLNEGTIELEKYYDDFREEFHQFFPELIDHCNIWKANYLE